MMNEEPLMPRLYCQQCWRPILWNPVTQSSVYTCVCTITPRFGEPTMPTGTDWLVADDAIAPSNTIAQQQRTAIPKGIYDAFTDDEVQP